MIVVEATYRRKTATDNWYDVMHEDRRIGEVYQTKRGYYGACANAPRKRLGPTKRKEELGQLIVAAWEAFPVGGA